MLILIFSGPRFGGAFHAPQLCNTWVVFTAVARRQDVLGLFSVSC